MNDLTLNENVFIRSMGTRGSLGGLSKKTADVVKLMDAFGMDLVIIETVGVGQSEVDIVKNADTTLVVLVPGLGDDIQAIKAGILEIGDVFAINKADRDGCDRLNVEIEMMLDLDSREVKWRPPIKRTMLARTKAQMNSSTLQMNILSILKILVNWNLVEQNVLVMKSSQ